MSSGMRWWQHPLVPVAWGVAAAAVYALFPSSDIRALVALLVFEAGFLVWMAVSERG
jgi:hypothetical protein